VSCRPTSIESRDYLLEELGWLHLHVGHGIDDRVLLIVEALDDRVFFIAVTDHSIFSERLRAKSLPPRLKSRAGEAPKAKVRRL
jgi:hypothetical protein